MKRFQRLLNDLTRLRHSSLNRPHSTGRRMPGQTFFSRANGKNEGFRAYLYIFEPTCLLEFSKEHMPTSETVIIPVKTWFRTPISQSHETSYKLTFCVAWNEYRYHELVQILHRLSNIIIKLTSFWKVWWTHREVRSCTRRPSRAFTIFRWFQIFGDMRRPFYSLAWGHTISRH